MSMDGYYPKTESFQIPPWVDANVPFDRFNPKREGLLDVARERGGELNPWILSKDVVLAIYTVLSLLLVK